MVTIPKSVVVTADTKSRPRGGGLLRLDLEHAEAELRNGVSVVESDIRDSRHGSSLLASVPAFAVCPFCVARKSSPQDCGRSGDPGITADTHMRFPLAGMSMSNPRIPVPPNCDRGGANSGWLQAGWVLAAATCIS